MALEDVAQAAGYYRGVSAQLAGSFLDEIDTTIEQILLFPEAGPMTAGKIRKALLRRFPYAILYEARSDEVVIIAVMHGKRRPGIWRERL